MAHTALSHPGEGHRCQGLHVELRIDPGGLQRAVPKDIRHVFEAGPLVDHLGGGRMPEGVGAEPRVTRRYPPAATSGWPSD